MIRAAAVFALLGSLSAVGAAPQAWNLNAIARNTWVLAPTTYTPASIGGNHGTSGWHKAIYDSVSGRTFVWDMWQALPTYRTSIYQNSLIEFRAATATASLFKISHWTIRDRSNGYDTIPLPENTTDPTPAPRHCSGALAFVAPQNAVYMTNGLNGSLPPYDHSGVNDTWKCDLATGRWTKLNSALHPALFRGADVMTYDEGEGKIVFLLATFAAGQTWTLDVATGQWSQANPPTEPPGDAVAAMAYDPVRRRTLMLSGDVGNDLWAYDARANTWTRLADAPATTSWVSFVYVPRYDVFISAFNPGDSLANPNRMMVYNPRTDTWTELLPPPGDTWPAIGRKSTMAYDVANDVLVYQGGVNDNIKWYVFRYDPGTPVAPTLRVTSPNGGETWTAGASASVTWTTTGTVGNVNIDLSTDGGTSWAALVSDTPNDGAQTVTVPNTPSTTCRVRVRHTSGTPSDVSDANFTIAVAAPPADSDGDGLPDTWETQYFGNLAQGAGGDPDGDGSTNLQEYQAGTDPTTAPPAPPPPSGGSGGGGTVPAGDDEGKEGCGATGLEVLILLPLLMRKRRRGTR